MNDDLLSPSLKFGTHDDLNRKLIASKLSLLFEKKADVFPLLIDGEWEAGKTEFCYKLINYLKDRRDGKEKDVPSYSAEFIYINAFEIEPMEEPLLSILAAIKNALPESWSQKFSKSLGELLLVFGCAATQGALSQLAKNFGCEEIVQKGIERGIEAVSTTSADKLLTAYAAREKNLAVIKSSIEQAAKDRRLLIFIDELDRCRPDFALNLFELVKYVFDISNVEFAFVANSRHLISMIRTRYGTEDANSYLEKFIKLSVTLPQSLTGINNESLLASMCLIEEYGRKSGIVDFYDRNSIIYKLILDTFKKYEVNLRVVNNFIRNINIYRIVLQDKIFYGNKAEIFTKIMAILVCTIDKNILKNIEGKNVPQLVNSFFHDCGESSLGCKIVAGIMGKPEYTNALREIFPNIKEDVLWYWKKALEIPSVRKNILLEDFIQVVDNVLLSRV